jgi:hypothetical protein
VRDGIRVSRWKETGGRLEVTPLVEDLKRAASGNTMKARIDLIGGAGDLVAVGWHKAWTTARERTLTLFRIDTAAL